MAKLKNPLLSFDTHGTLSDILTFQRIRGTVIARSKPTPPKLVTLSQQYHRWDYSDWLSPWNLLTPSEKQSWESAARRYHITGLNLYLREKLEPLTNLVGRWRLDEPGGQFAYDSSKHGNTGILRGTTPATGLISGCRYFDGVDDTMQVLSAPELEIGTQDFSVLLRCSIQQFGVNQAVIRKNLAGNTTGYGVHFQAYNKWTLRLLNTWWIIGPKITDSDWHTYGFLYDRDDKVTMIMDGRAVATQDITGEQGDLSNANDIWVGGTTPLAYEAYKGYLDQLEIYDRLLSPAEAIVKLARRYP